MKNKKGTWSIESISILALIFGLGIVITSIIGDVTTNIKEGITRNTLIIHNETTTTITVGTSTSLNNLYASAISWVKYNNGTVSLGSTEFSLVNANKDNSQLNITNLSQANNSFLVNFPFLKQKVPFNVSQKGQKGQINFSNWFVTIGLVVGGSIIL